MEKKYMCYSVPLDNIQDDWLEILKTQILQMGTAQAYSRNQYLFKSADERMFKDDAVVFGVKDELSALMERPRYRKQFINSDHHSPKDAFKIYTVLSELGNLDAINRLGMCHVLGVGTAKDEKKGLETFLQLARSKAHPAARCNVGYCYLRGIGVKPDAEMAVKWFVLAAVDGNPEAQFWLGNCFRLGMGVERDINEAYQWLHKAAAKTNRKDYGECFDITEECWPPEESQGGSR